MVVLRPWVLAFSAGAFAFATELQVDCRAGQYKSQLLDSAGTKLVAGGCVDCPEGKYQPVAAQE
jgi:hypothetical protein